MDFRIAEIVSLYVALWICRNGQSIPEDLYNYNIVPPNRFEHEPWTNKTVDDLILAATGDINGALNSKTINGHILTEFDMLLTKEQYDSLYEKPNRPFIRSKRKAYKLTYYWPNGEIPYLFQPGDFDQKDQDEIRQSMMEWERYTCVRFRKANSYDKNKVVFFDGKGCYSNLGMIVNGPQGISLNKNGCRNRITYLHELGHTIGLVHEHSRPDRDQFVEVLFSHMNTSLQPFIPKDKVDRFLKQFTKYTVESVYQMNVPYDYSSVMHYPVKIKGLKTMRIKCTEKEADIGNNRELSYGDVKIVNKMYNCLGNCKPGTRCSGGVLDENCLCICKTGSQDCDIGGGSEGSGSTCENINYDTACWYLEQLGACEKYPIYSKQYCARACGFCDDMRKPEACTKSYPRDECFKWSKNGDCRKNYEW